MFAPYLLHDVSQIKQQLRVPILSVTFIGFFLNTKQLYTASSNTLDHIHFRLLFLSSKHQTPVSKRSIKFSEVIAMKRTTLATVDLDMTSSFAESKEGMYWMLLFPQYLFFNHFKLTTPYLPIHCSIFQQYHTLEADSHLFIHENSI